ncbi:5644_t:CDS:10 [Funneliformis geosporum]|uniref:5644_t:CDS:1 n=1 Tax=Funneliformis geosporum TaxID=1117311 RepID=A0A9W4WQZ0_9GLOM|nr:5644_t:CDS:10 [Funneliformis geosporum]
MFWRLGLNHSAIDGLLDKEDLTLEELLDEDDLIQECKAHNNKLIEYLRDPVILSQLLNYIVRDDLDERQKFKYPYVACEVLSCEIWAICEAVIDNADLLNSFWQLLDRPPPLDPSQASHFTKVNVVFMQKKMNEMVKFIQSIPNVVKKMLNHLENSAIVELLLKLISVEEYPEGAGVIDWLNSEGLLDALISQLDPNVDPEVHSTVTQVLIDIVAISQSSNPDQGGVGPNALSRDLISEKTVTRLVDYMLDPVAPNSTSTLINGISIFIQIIQKNNSDYHEDAMSQLQQHPVVDLSDMLRVLANRVGEFKALLDSPKSVSGQIETTIGKIVPLGFERFRTCELLAELLHCSNMSLLNSVRHDTPTNGFFELKRVEDYNDYGQVLGSNISNSNYQTQKIDEFQTAMDIQGNEDTKQKDSQQEEIAVEQSTNPVSSPILMDIFEETQESSGSEYVTPTDNSNGPVSSELPVFTDGHLTKRITMAQRLNDSEVEKPKGVRLGYMGHLTFIAEEVVKLLDNYAVEIGEKVIDFIAAEDWQEYVSKTLFETRKRDREPLGGHRPNTHDTMPPRWIGDDFDRDDLDMRGTFATPNMLEGDPFENRRSSLDEEFRGDSDDEDNSSQWHSSLQESKQLLTVADWTADFQSAFKSSDTIQTSDSTSLATVTTIITPNTSDTSIEISSSNSKSPIIKIQESSDANNNIKEDHENNSKLEGLITVRSNVVSVIDNPHKQESTDTLCEEGGKPTDFDKMGVSVEETGDNKHKDVQKPNEKIQDDTKTLS